MNFSENLIVVLVVIFIGGLETCHSQFNGGRS